VDSIENVNIEEAPGEVLPRCPYCKKDLDKIWIKRSGLGLYGQKEIVMCPYCQSFLS
jgi:uncharacterized Zn-finger protein